LNRIVPTFIFALLISLLQACTWVKVTPEGAKVRVATSSEIGSCESKGEVTSSLKSRVGAFERKPGKVAGELETLARNEAALMGGDTVVAKTNVKEGRQIFDVYRCQT